jgi:uncharacterized protein YjbI with pentapeptide repeats
LEVGQQYQTIDCGAKWQCKWLTRNPVGYCILHDPSPNKDTQEFSNSVNNLISDARNTGFLQLDGVFFPYVYAFDAQFNRISISLRESRFEGLANFEKMIFGTHTDFTSTRFAAGANFCRAKFEGPAIFLDARFGVENDTSFAEATFTGPANFSEAIFEGRADFSAATFKKEAEFLSTVFHVTARFRESIFEDDANFHDATFEMLADFNGATFAREASFHGAKFKLIAGFDGTKIQGEADFGKVIFEGVHFLDTELNGEVSFFEATLNKPSFFNVKFNGPATFSGATFQGEAEFLGSTFAGETDFNGAIFETASFSKAVFSQKVTFFEATLNKSYFWRATFHGPVEFVSTKFVEGVFFEGTQFYDFVNLSGVFRCRAVFLGEHDNLLFGKSREVNFNDAILEQPNKIRFAYVDFSRVRLFGTDIRGVDLSTISWPQRGRWFWKRNAIYEPRGSDVAALENTYRQIRQSYEDRRNYPEAGDFYYGEMHHKRKRYWWRRYLPSLTSLYWICSSYGQRPLQAALILLLLVAGFSAMLLWFGMYVEENAPLEHASFWTVLWAYTLRVVSFGSPLYFTPATKWGELISTLARLIVPVQAALFVLAIHRAFTR